MCTRKIPRSAQITRTRRALDVIRMRTPHKLYCVQTARKLGHGHRALGIVYIRESLLTRYIHVSITCASSMPRCCIPYIGRKGLE